MKLADYIKEENIDIVQQYDEIEKSEKTLSDLQKLYEQIEIDEDLLSFPKESPCDKNADTNNVTIVKFEKNQFKQREHKLNDLKNNLTVSRESSTIHLEVPDNAQDKPNKNYTFSFGAEQTNKREENLLKTEYRNDLLNQIEEKKRLKQLELEKRDESEKLIETKISQQQLKMYKEFNEEQKKGNFLTKHKTIDAQADSTQNLINLQSRFSGGKDGHVQKDNKKTPTRSIVREANNRKTIANKPIVGQGSKGDFNVEDYLRSKVIQDEKGKLKSQTTDTNMLASLNEVRKIMQDDHIEMLEKILNFQPKTNLYHSINQMDQAS